MTRVDFYILPSAEQSECLLFTCRLIEKAHRMGHQLYVHTDSEQTTAEMKDALWSFRADSFLPHQAIDETPQTKTTIEIGHQADPKHHHDILINLAPETPSFFSRFDRVAEMVVQKPEALEASRKSFAFYRDRGYPLQTHDLRKK